MFRLLFFAATGGIIGALVLHYLIFGPRHRALATDPPRLQRFSLWERAAHALALLSFVALVVTGFAGPVFTQARLSSRLWFLHMAAAPALAAGVAAMAVSWAADCGLAAHDWQWIKRFGGYLGGSQDAPAGRFNAGQKLFFWVVLLVAIATLVSGAALAFPAWGEDAHQFWYQAHRFSALAFLLLGIVHLYLATLANPGTLRAMIGGYVGLEWARRHHPIWWREITGDDRRETLRDPSAERE